MELDKFIAETLIAISKGVETAQNDQTQGAQINPTFMGDSAGVQRAHRGNKRVKDVQFDVALTVEDTAEGGGKISVFGSNVGGSKGNKETLTSRVSFSVPVAFK